MRILTVNARWRIARLLNRLPGQCWADLASWAALRERRLPWSPQSWLCREDARACGVCYCNKLRAPSGGDR